MAFREAGPSAAHCRRAAVVVLTTAFVSVVTVGCTSSGRAGAPPASQSAVRSTSSGTPVPPSTSEPATSTSAAEPLPGAPDTPLPKGAVTIALHGADATAGALALAADSQSIWTIGGAGIYRIDARTKLSVRTSDTPLSDGDVATGDGAVWQSDYDGGTVHRIDPRTGRVVATIAIPGGTPEGVAWTPGSVWVASHHGGGVARINTISDTVTALVKVTDPGDNGALDVVAGRNSVWVGAPNSGEVVRIDPANGRLVGKTTFFEDGFSPCGGLAVTSTSVWVSSCFSGTQLAALDAATGKRTRTVDIGGNVLRSAPDADTVWFVATANPDGEDPPSGPSVLVHLGADGRVLTKYPLPKGFTSGGIVVAFGRVWAASSSTPMVIGIPLPG